jgi:molybdenum cofactor cytidylyltransferase
VSPQGDVLGVIPAAGLSSRIGGNPKPLLETGSGTFLERTIRALREGGSDLIMVGVRHDPGPVAAEARRAGARVLVPPDLEAGPVATLQGAIHIVRQERSVAEADGGPPSPLRALLFLPADFPLVQGTTVRVLIEAWRETGASLVLPLEGERTGHPALFAGPLLDELLDPTLPEGARSVVDAHRSEAIQVSVEDPGIHVDIDTLPEYRRHFPAAYRKRFQKW